MLYTPTRFVPSQRFELSYHRHDFLGFEQFRRVVDASAASPSPRSPVRHGWDRPVDTEAWNASVRPPVVHSTSEATLDVSRGPELEIYPVRLLLFGPLLSVVRRFPTS